MLSLLSAESAVLDIDVSNNVTVVRGEGSLRKKSAVDLLMSVLAQIELEIGEDLQRKSLLHFRRIL